MVLKSFTIPYTTCLKKTPAHSLLVISSIFVYALCSGFHLLTFLLTCFALLLAAFAFASPILRPTSIPPQQTQYSLKQEKPFIAQGDDACGSEESDPTEECSDGSISDEESLIEIALPSGNYMEPERHDEQQALAGRCALQHKWWAESFQQQRLMAELLAEINDFYEEDNMIEIDLSMGSIKCPRFEIKA